MFAEINRKAYSFLPFVLNTVGQSPKQSPVCHPEGIKYHEFIWVKSGSGKFSFQDKSFIFKEGDGVFIRRNVPHSYEGDDLHTGWCTFSMEEGLLDYMGVPDFLIFKAPPFLNNQTDELMNSANSDSTVISRSAAGYTYVTELLCAILEPSDSAAVKIQRFLENNYSKPLTLDDIAAEAEMDKFSLCRYYSQKKGIGVIEELKLIRIDKAKRFLRYSSDPIQKIGYICGFESPSYFAKRFREESGYTPSEYRKLHKI